MFDIRHISRVAGAAAVGVLALGLLTAQGAAGPVTFADDAVHPGQVSSAKRTTGWLKVVLDRSRTYTVVGDGFEQSASATTRFTVPAGWYTVTAPGGTVTPGKVRVWAGTQSEVAVTFHGTPITGTAVAVGDGFACALAAGGTILCWGSNESGQLGAARLLGLWPGRCGCRYRYGHGAHRRGGTCVRATVRCNDQVLGRRDTVLLATDSRARDRDHHRDGDQRNLCTAVRRHGHVLG